MSNTAHHDWKHMIQCINKAAQQNEFFEVTEDMFNHFLQSMPLMAMKKNAFLAGEPVRHDNQNQPVYYCFYISEGRFFGGLQTIKQFNQKFN